MSHLDFIRPGGVYAPEQAPGANDYQRLDENQRNGVNGDAGGVWNPSSPIVMGGSGVTLTTAASNLSGGVSTATGGRVQVDAGYGANQPVLTAPLGDTIVLPMLDLLSPLGDFGSGFSWLMDDDVGLSDATGAFGAQCALSLSNATFVPVPSRYLHQTASLSKLRLHFRVPTKPLTNAALPSLAFAPWIYEPALQTQYLNFAPNFATWTSGGTYAVGAYVVPVNGHVNGYYYKATAITSGVAGTNPAIFDGHTTVGLSFTDGGVTWTTTGFSGQISQVGLDAAAYYNNGQPQVLEFDFDNASAPLLARNAIDHGLYTYGILVGGEGDNSQVTASVNIVLHAVEIIVSNIVDLSFE